MPFQGTPEVNIENEEPASEAYRKKLGTSNQVREAKYREFVREWINYFKLADMKSLLIRTDEWVRRRIRMVYWKQWKKVRTRYRMLKALDCEHWKTKELACSRKGYWRMVSFNLLYKELIH